MNNKKNGINPAKRKIKPFDLVMYGLIYLFSFFTLASLVWIVTYILSKGLPHISWEFLTSNYSRKQQGILPMILTTLYMIGYTLIISVPIGIGSAIYLTEYAKPGKLVNSIRFATETLAGIPSILYGLFGYIFFVQVCNLKLSILAASFTLSILVLPTIIRTTEESIRTVPRSYKEGSLALGASRLWTLFRIILPSSISGILTSIILSVGRIVGESAAVIFTAGTALVAFSNISPQSSSRSLTVHMYYLAKEGLDFNIAFATASVLIIIVFIINLIATLFASKLQKKAGGQ